MRPLENWVGRASRPPRLAIRLRPDVLWRVFEHLFEVSNILMRPYLLIITLVFCLSSCATPEMVKYEKRIKENPQDSQAHYRLALAYLKKGISWEVHEEVGVPVLKSRWWVRKAKRHLDKTVKLNPFDPEPHYWLKVIYNVRGKYPAADRERELYARLKGLEKRSSHK